MKVDTPQLENVTTGDLVAELNSRGHNPEDAKAEQIVSLIARRYGIDRTTLLTKHKEGKNVAAYLIRKCTELTWAELSDMLGYSDHTGAVYACKKGEQTYEAEGFSTIWGNTETKQ